MNDPVTNYLAHVDGLLADPLQVARASAKSGSRVVGYVGDEIPVTLIAASGALPQRLRGRAGRATPLADEIVESAFTPAMRDIAEQWLAGDLDFLDAVVFPRADDSAQRLYYYLCESQRRGHCAGPKPLLLDMAKISRPTSIAHSRDSIRMLARELGVEAGRCAGAGQRVARREALMASIRSRRLGPAPLPGGMAWRVLEVAEYDWRDSHDEATREWLSRAPTLAEPLRVVLAGNAPPDDSLHRAIEATGGTVVLELTSAVTGGEALDGVDLDLIADHFQSRQSPVLAMRQDPAWVARRAREVRADAVVLWLIEEDEALPWEIARQMRSLRETGMATLLLTRQPWLVDEPALDQVRQFVNRSRVAR